MYLFSLPLCKLLLLFVVTCYTEYGTSSSPMFPLFFTFVTAWTLLHSSISFDFCLSSFRTFHHIPDTSIGFPRCHLLIRTLVYIVQ
ncbi:hypothetical protein J3R30DRAFT_1495063 [Lentinula aciculospora]|uniref:Secreted peptide n=1 Tax=Lentinula aciculospora TaxID=153920 RepID=A0A9W9DU62_9AGAR|nr:hypothetical protein J3R30DRAFT_1495063 [Lentinula aciculospora]